MSVMTGQRTDEQQPGMDKFVVRLNDSDKEQKVTRGSDSDKNNGH